MEEVYMLVGRHQDDGFGIAMIGDEAEVQRERERLAEGSRWQFLRMLKCVEIPPRDMTTS